MNFIKSVQFSQLTSNEARKLATAIIQCGNEDHNDKVLSDPTFGNTDNSSCLHCPSPDDCPGHVGLIELRHRIFHPLHISFITQLLFRMCWECKLFDASEVVIDSTPKVQETSAHIYDIPDWDSNFITSTKSINWGDDVDTEFEPTIRITRPSKECPRCNKKLAERIRFVCGLTTSDDTSLYSEGERKHAHHLEVSFKKEILRLSPRDVYEMLTKNIDVVREYVQDNSFDPSRIIIDFILVIPPVCRPSVVENGLYMTDSMTLQYKILMTKAYELQLATSERYCSTMFAMYRILLGLNAAGNGATKNLRQRLTGKQGYFRQCCLAKRENYCGRSVISPDPTLRLNEIGLPLRFKESLRIDEGELVIANRQPSLERTSMLALKAVFSDKAQTIRLNPAVITPFNADFDGDEMSIYAVLGKASIAEAERLMSVQRNLLSCKNETLNFGVAQDIMTGLHILSLEKTKVDASTLTRRVRLSLMGNTGKAFISCMFPEDFNHETSELTIRNGIFHKGELTKSNFWTSKKSVLHTYLKLYGPIEFIKFIDILGERVGSWIRKYGLTVQLRDLVTDTPKMNITCDDNPNALRVYKMHTEEVSMQNCRGGLRSMIQAGTKGDRNNVGQIMACVGQQSAFGQSIQEKLPHFIREETPRAYGFVESSYLSGLKPDELFYHSQMGREGIIRTGITTADTGYTQRSVIKLTEGLTMQSNDTVQDDDGSIVQYRYGNDSIDLSKSDNICIERLSTFME